MPFVCPHALIPNHIDLFKLHQIFAMCYVCTRLLCYGRAATYGCFPVMSSVEAYRYGHTVTATPLQHRARTNTPRA